MSAVQSTSRLTKPTIVEVAGATRNLADFYRNNQGVWTSPNFQQFILSGILAGEVTTPDARLLSADLALKANADEIDEGIPEGKTFTERNQFLGHGATLIAAQPGGPTGLLLTNDYLANIFHVEFVPGQPFAVNFHWCPDAGQWDCHANPRDAHRWRAGYRAFRNCP